MKNTKKIITLALAAAMLSATGITAFAETTNVSYNVDPSYTVSIPASVTLGDADVTADIEASDVLLEDGKQIKVDLSAASNTASGSTFNAKNGDSAVTYTISAGDKTIAVNDTVATFTANGSKTLTFSAADKSAATAAGAHTETLTFGISVEDAVTPYTPQTYTSLTVGTILHVGDALDLTEDLDLEHGFLNSNYIWTLVRGNISSYGEEPFAEVTFTESDNGDYYVFKGVYRTDPTTVYMKYDAIPVTATSDGITVTALNESNVRFAVHES